MQARKIAKLKELKKKEACDDFLKAQARPKDKEAYEFLLSDERGRWFLTKLLVANYYYKSTFTGNADTYRKEGARKAVLAVTDEIRKLGEEGVLQLLRAEGERFAWIREQEANFERSYKDGRNR